MTTVFVSHGAPSLILEPGETGQMLARMAASLPRPEAILVVSAHWDTRVPAVSLATQPETIHDFGGFPAELYAKQYPAPGALALANRVAGLLQASDIPVQTAERGLDHGAWVPLSLMYPAADIPVTQLSIQSRSTPAQQFALGRALQPLHAQNVLILASGAVTHNLSDFFTGERDTATVLPYVHSFADWVADQLLTGQLSTLLNYRAECPQGIQAHPAEDHLMPLFVAAGSAHDTPERFAPETTYGILAMDAYVWKN